MLGGDVESKNTTFVMPRSLQMLFDCKFMFLNEFNWYFDVFCCYERLNLQLRLKIDVQIYLYSPIARVDCNTVDVQVRVSNPQRIGFANNQF